jgi:outer membrane lipoprotein SlyB
VVNTKAYEYVVRTAAKGELLSVTQRDTTPLAIGQNVLLIAGTQARIVPDYTFEPAALAARAADAPPRAAAPPAAATEVAPAEPAPPAAPSPPPVSVPTPEAAAAALTRP